MSTTAGKCWRVVIGRSSFIPIVMAQKMTSDCFVQLIEELGEHDIGWSFDADGSYTHAEAHRIGQILDAAGWEFFEAPLPDTDLRGYKNLADTLDIDVICGGNTPSPMAATDRVRTPDRVRGTAAVST